MSEDITRLGYSDLAHRFDLGTLKEGADITFEILNGDFQLGDIPHNALHRFVVPWQFNAPMLKTAFDFVFAGKAKKAAHEQELNQIVKQRFGASMETRQAIIEKSHTLFQEIGIEELGPQAYAGTIMVILTSLLRFEWVNLGKPKRWDTAGNLINGFSVGQIVDAAANNFRHSDEWMLTHKPDEKQLKSMRPLAAVLNMPLAADGSGHPFGTNVCPAILEKLSDGSFEGLMNVVFPYARALAYDS